MPRYIGYDNPVVSATGQQGLLPFRQSRRSFYRKQRMSQRGKRQGKGAFGIRYFKLRTVFSLAVGTPTAGEIQSSTPIYDTNPVLNPAQDWASIVNLFDTYRVNAVKVQWVPNSPADSAKAYYPCYVLCDWDATSLPAATALLALQYENCRIKNLYLPWTYYCKPPKVVGTGDTTRTFNDGYMDTSDTPTNLGQIEILAPGLSGTSVYGSVVKTWYISCKDRR